VSIDFIVISLCCYNAEPAKWLFAAQVQERFWLAEALGRFHEFLSLFLQVASGKLVLLFFSVIKIE